MVQANATEQIDAVFLGNPILDITQDDQDKALLTKYKLEIGMATLATIEQLPLIDEVFTS